MGMSKEDTALRMSGCIEHLMAGAVRERASEAEAMEFTAAMLDRYGMAELLERSSVALYRRWSEARQTGTPKSQPETVTSSRQKGSRQVGTQGASGCNHDR